MSDTLGTVAWLRKQWSNPGDIFTILLIIGGDIIQAAIAQLCAGPVPYLTPVSFSFGWAAYAVSAMLSAVGENSLMPRPELDCLVINVKSGYRRKNYSWIVSRLLRDFDYWRPATCNDIEATKLDELRTRNDEALAEHHKAAGSGREHRAPPATSDIRVGLRVTVWQCQAVTGVGSGDPIYWSGLGVSLVQLSIAVVPWGLYNEWFIFFVTAVGTILAYASGALPQWAIEKRGVRKVRERKDIMLTEGNGAHDVILLLGCDDGLDLEALAAPQRDLPAAWRTRALSLTLAALWVALLISVAGWEQHAWYLLGIGIIGILHNVTVAGAKRQPDAFGIYLTYKATLVEGKVMEVLRLVEESYPQSGASLLNEFFPGKLDDREQALWNYAARRTVAWKSGGKREIWPMPPLRRPSWSGDDGDIPSTGAYVPREGPNAHAQHGAAAGIVNAADAAPCSEHRANYMRDDAV